MRSALAVNGALAPAPAPASPRAALAAAPRGAYTALAVTPARAVPHWQAHLERLAHSLVVLSRGEGGSEGCLPSFAAWHASREPALPLPLASLLGDAVLPTLRAAVDGVGVEAGRDVFAVVLLHEPAAPPAPPPPAAATASLLPPVDVVVYAWSPDPDAPPPTSPAVAAVVGGPRPAPDAKDSGWVAARAPLEAALPGLGATDGLLVNGAGCLLESLVGNVFVVEEEGDGAAGGPAPARTLVTAPASAPLLDGVARRAALAAADRVGVAVRLAPPDPGRRAGWREAFTTSAVAGIKPLAALVGPGWRVDFAPVPGLVTAALAAELPAVLEHASLAHL
jgi:branched-subunit amino acid aminotransferase/4-amino-4-deoxychorismate lyase